MDNSRSSGGNGYDPKQALAACLAISESEGWRYLQALVASSLEHDEHLLMSVSTDFPQTQYLRGRISAFQLFMDGPQRIIYEAESAMEDVDRRNEENMLKVRRYVPREL